MELEQLQKIMDELHPRFQKVKMEAFNLGTAANINGFQVDWDKGLVTKK